MRIQHNIMAMNAYRNYNNNTSAVSKNLEKLSSGYKINRAGDDAAGLAISEKMRAQITGLNAAQKNVKDGISLVKTAEGAMQEIQDMLNRMDYLATQSANGTYDNEVDRANLQKEVKSLKEEINRIADSANFNGIKLLDGSLDSKSIREDSVTTGGVNNMFNLPDVGDNLGVDTILHKNPTGVGKTSFSVNFGNQTFENQEGDKLTLTLGEGDNAVEMVLEGTADGKGMQAEDIAKALAEKYGDGGAEKLMLKDADGNEQEFTVTLGDNGYSLKFEQVNDPMSDGQVVEAPRSAKIEGTAGNVTPPPAPDADPGEKGVYSYDITTAFAAGDKLTIAGKDIIFGITDDPDNNTINAGANNTAELQAAKIAELFKDDANWTVQTDYEAKLAANPADTSGDKSMLIFTQKTPSEDNVLEAPTTGSAVATTGELGAVTAQDAYVAAKPSYDFTGKALATGHQITIGKLTVKFSNAGANAATDTIQVGGTTASLATDLDTLAKYITANFDRAGVTAKVEGSKLVLTPNEGTNAPTIATTDVAQVSGGATPTVKDNGDGTWSISVGTAANTFANGDKLNILGASIDVVTTAAAGKLTAGATAAQTATEIADAMNSASNAAAALANPTDAQKNLGNLKFTVQADGTILVEQKIKNEESIGQISQVDVTTVGAAAAAANAPAAVDQGTGANAAKSASWTVSIDKVFAAGDKLVLSDGTNTAEIKFVSGTATATNGEIQIDAADDAKTLATKIETLLATPANVANFGALGFTITAEKDANGVNTGNLLIKQSTAGQGNAEDLKISVGRTDTVTGAGTFATVTAPKDPEVVDAPDMPDTPTMTPSKDYLVDVSTINQGAPASNTRLASTVFELTDDIIKDGNILKIGDQTFTVKLSADTEAVEGTELLDLSNLAEGADVLHEAAIKLSNATANNSVFESNGYDGNKVSFLENKSKNLNADGSSKVDLSTFDKVKEQFMYGTAEQVTEAKMGSALTLQIGDTSDSFNQMKVNVGDMHTKAMVYEDKDGNTTSIEDIDIGTQDGATKAVDVIKNAINYVSGVRGDLGAIQNRLEHTANNLSVMAENIQDAESAIRDTDIAEEMMAYTKNNILVQSAQAMLAQANQVPQGVLQLLG